MLEALHEAGHRSVSVDMANDAASFAANSRTAGHLFGANPHALKQTDGHIALLLAAGK